MRPTLHPVTSPRTPGSAGLWRSRYERDRSRAGEAHAATQAALGRWHAHTLAAVPQWDATAPAAVAWYRLTETRPGYMNRRARRHAIERAAASWCAPTEPLQPLQTMEPANLLPNERRAQQELFSAAAMLPIDQRAQLHLFDADATPATAIPNQEPEPDALDH